MNMEGYKSSGDKGITQNESVSSPCHLVTPSPKIEENGYFSSRTPL